MQYVDFDGVGGLCGYVDGGQCGCQDSGFDEIVMIVYGSFLDMG